MVTCNIHMEDNIYNIKQVLDSKPPPAQNQQTAASFTTYRVRSTNKNTSGTKLNAVPPLPTLPENRRTL